MDQVAPSLFQMFSPARSPFYAMAAGAALGMIAISGEPLAAYGLGLLVFIMAASVIGSIFLGTKLSEFQFNYAIMHARTVGVFGGLISLSTLIVSYENNVSGMFHVCWALCLIHIGIMLTTLAIKSKSFSAGKPWGGEAPVVRFNIVQFSLVNTVLLSALANISSEAEVMNYFDESSISEIATAYLAGAFFTAISPASILNGAISDTDRLTACLLFLATNNIILGAVCIAREVRFGRKSQVEEITYS